MCGNGNFMLKYSKIDRKNVLYLLIYIRYYYLIRKTIIIINN